MTEEHIRKYFSALVGDLNSNGWTNNAILALQEVNMKYQKVRIERIINPECDFKIIVTNDNLAANPGQFLFAWLPGIG